MRLLLAWENKEIRELLSFQLSSRFSIDVQEMPDVEDAAGFLEGEDNAQVAEATDIVLTFHNDKSNPLTEYLIRRNKPMPLILVYENKAPDADSLKGLLPYGSVEIKNVVEGTAKLLSEFLGKSGEIVDPDDFCQIHTSLLIRVSPLKSDIYIRLSKKKYIKLFQEGMVFSLEDLERYYKVKKVEYMYLKRGETAEFMHKFSSELDTLLAKPGLSMEEAIQTTELTQEMIQDLIHRVGFSTEVQALAKKNVAVTVKALGQSPKLSSVISRIQAGGNYISQHSSMLAFISCCLAKEMSWGSDTTFTKLVIASYMHDISIKDPEIAKINSLPELQEQSAKFSEEEVKNFHLHPMRSADVVKSFQEIPPDVDLIVSHHHERPNGSGFPRGLQHNYIAPLAAVFIVAHDLVQEILNKRAQFNMPDFVEGIKANYSQGNFKKVVAALDKMKLE